MMHEYLIRDSVTGETAWVAAPSLRDALIKRENELRAAAKGVGLRPGKPLLPAKTKVSHYSVGAIINVSVADVSCVGLVDSVVRAVAL